jgi:hypothetical protein
MLVTGLGLLVELTVIVTLGRHATREYEAGLAAAGEAAPLPVAPAVPSPRPERWVPVLPRGRPSPPRVYAE